MKNTEVKDNLTVYQISGKKVCYKHNELETRKYKINYKDEEYLFTIKSQFMKFELTLSNGYFIDYSLKGKNHTYNNYTSTKTSYHSFFKEMSENLKDANKKETMIIKNALILIDIEETNQRKIEKEKINTENKTILDKALCTLKEWSNTNDNKLLDFVKVKKLFNTQKER